MLYNLDYILNDIEQHIVSKKPFSLIRPGDGDLYILKGIQEKDINLKVVKREGIPLNYIDWLSNHYQNVCNNANYISSFDMCFDGTFWNRKPNMQKHLRDWKIVYQRNCITNTNYCNPEINFLFFLQRRRNLFSIMEKRKICIVTCFLNVKDKLRNFGYDVENFIVPGRYQNHFSVYNENIEKLKEKAIQFDMFLVGAGALGRGYSNCIKQSGGVAIDVGQVFDCWSEIKIVKRLKGLLKINKDLTFSTIKEVKHFKI